MQNKPNFQNEKMNASNSNTMTYKIFTPLAGYKNKPNSNPIKPNFKTSASPPPKIPSGIVIHERWYIITDSADCRQVLKNK